MVASDQRSSDTDFGCVSFFYYEFHEFHEFGCALFLIITNYSNEIASDFLPAAANSFNSLNS